MLLIFPTMVIFQLGVLCTYIVHVKQLWLRHKHVRHSSSTRYIWYTWSLRIWWENPNKLNIAASPCFDPEKVRGAYHISYLARILRTLPCRRCTSIYCIGVVTSASHSLCACLLTSGVTSWWWTKDEDAVGSRAGSTCSTSRIYMPNKTYRIRKPQQQRISHQYKKKLKKNLADQKTAVVAQCLSLSTALRGAIVNRTKYC